MMLTIVEYICCVIRRLLRKRFCETKSVALKKLPLNIQEIPMRIQFVRTSENSSRLSSNILRAIDSLLNFFNACHASAEMKYK